MAVYLTAAAAAAGDPAQLTAAADTLTALSTTIDEQALAVQRAVDSTRDFWSGPASNAYRTRAQQQVITVGRPMWSNEAASGPRRRSPRRPATRSRMRSRI